MHSRVALAHALHMGVYELQVCHMCEHVGHMKETSWKHQDVGVGERNRF